MPRTSNGEHQTSQRSMLIATYGEALEVSYIVEREEKGLGTCCGKIGRVKSYVSSIYNVKRGQVKQLRVSVWQICVDKHPVLATDTTTAS